MTSRNPYLIEGPAQICFSGGRTSGYMLHQLLEANGGLPNDCIVTFQNTGKEREETLVFIKECASRWHVPITWIEWDGFEEGSRSRCHVRTADFDTASRKGEPFSRLNEALGILPNPVMRTCTANLKVKTGRSFMRSLGYTEWDNVMGIRADEPRRVARLLSPGRDNSGGIPNLPLARAGVLKADVLAFWRDQPFDLALDPEGDFGNCDACFLKARHKIVRAFVSRPDLATWWINEESRPSEATFRNDRPRYSELLREAEFYAKQFLLAFPEPEEDALIDCMCGD
ncbi:Nin-like protein [Burkholderia multivorans]|uniref:Nin-like protein n=1 Tax=Burkholderia multivorans TaxID=87883 RepID=UPI001B95F06D|nr:Nin-like protein [Burkholderia multivorans]MBR7900295.1 Nin-like protein [Burkholderia multivorans]